MSKRFLNLFAIVAFTIGATPILAQPGVILSFDNVNSKGKKIEEFTIESTDNLIKWSSNDLEQKSGSNEMIYNSSKQEMTIIDHQSKSYFIINKTKMEQMGKKVSAAMKQAEETMKNLPPEAKAQLEKMQKSGQIPAGMTIPGMESPKVETSIVNTGQQSDKEGYPCTRFNQMENGNVQAELWVTSWTNIKGGTKVKNNMLSMASFYKSMMESLFNESGNHPMANKNWFSDMDKVDGMPVIVLDNESERTTSLKSIQGKTFKAAHFKPNPSYKQQNLIQEVD